MRGVLGVALLTISLALPRSAFALLAPAVSGVPHEPEVPHEPGVPEVQRPGVGAGEPLSSGTGSVDGTTTTTPPMPVTDVPDVTGPVVTGPVAPRRPVVRPQVGVVEAPAGGVQPEVDGMPRYYRAPFNDSVWPSLVGRELLMVFGSGARECVTLTKKTPDALFYVHRKNGQQQAPLSAVTSLHEHSWECKAHDSTPSEWARSGAAVGLGLSALGFVMGALYDVGHPDPRCERDAVEGVMCAKGGGKLPHFVYSVVGVTTTTLATPVVAIGGASTSRDLRVRGKIWARATGWTFYSAATLMNVLWLVGYYGDVESLQVRGLTTSAGVLGMGGAAFMSVDALMSRQELISLRRQDAQRSDRPTARAGLRFGAQPIGTPGQMHGLSLGVGGRF